MEIEREPGGDGPVPATPKWPEESPAGVFEKPFYPDATSPVKPSPTPALTTPVKPTWLQKGAGGDRVQETPPTTPGWSPKVLSPKAETPTAEKVIQDELVTTADPQVVVDTGVHEVEPRRLSKVYQQEWVSSPSWTKKGIGIALGVMTALTAGLIAALCVIFLVEDIPSKTGRDRMTLFQLLENHFAYRTFNGSWMSDHEFLYRNGDGDLNIYDAVSKNSQSLVSSHVLDEYEANSWSLSPNRKYLLLEYKSKPLFRHSKLSKYILFRLPNGTQVAQYEHILSAEDDPDFQIVIWGPVNATLFFVRDNNIFYKDLEVSPSKVQQLTNDGQPGVWFNGVPDWLYEEEILSSNNAMWISPDGSKICYAQFNDTEVPEYVLQIYGDDIEKNLYPESVSIRYPKPGEKNPNASLLITWLNGRNDSSPVRLMPPADVVDDMGHYFTAIKWVSPDWIYVIWMNRKQTKAVAIMYMDPFNEHSNILELFREDTEGFGWADQFSAPIYGNGVPYEYYYRGIRKGNNNSLFRQVIARKTNNETKFLTNFEWDVETVYAYDGDWVYFTSIKKDHPEERHLYKVRPLDEPPEPKCLTCDFAYDYKYFRPIFSPDAKYYILNCLGPAVPSTILFSTASNDNELTLLDANSDIQDKEMQIASPRKDFLVLKMNSGYNARVKVLQPPDLDSSAIGKYPLVVQVYAGPGGQLALNTYSVDWGTYLSSNKGYVYAMFDVRGSSEEGEARKWEMYYRLGTAEIDDQIEATDHLLNRLPYLNRSRVAVWGWSYGGYSTAMILGRNQDILKCGISVAPVVDWRLYDTAYTERYMGYPSENPSGYEEGSVLKYVKNFRGKKFYLIHGTGDDNVHFQNSMMLTRALAAEEIPFRAQVYPDEQHHLGHVKRHLYQSMENFLEECLQ